MGGRILLGISDEGEIKGESLSGAMKAEVFSVGRNCDPPIEVTVAQVGQIVVVSVPVGDEKPHACGGVYYRRFDAVTQKLNRNEIKSLFEAGAHLHFDEKLNPTATIADLSLEKFRAFIKETGKLIAVTKTSMSLLLESLRLIHGGRVTNAGVMMFANDSGKFLMHCQAHLVIGAHGIWNWANTKAIKIGWSQGT